MYQNRIIVTICIVSYITRGSACASDNRNIWVAIAIPVIILVISNVSIYGNFS